MRRSSGTWPCGDLFINRRDLCDYEGGFGNMITFVFLADLADRQRAFPVPRSRAPSSCTRTYPT